MWAESGGLSAEGFEEELFSNPSALGTFMVDDVFGPKVVQLKFWISIFSMIKIKNAYNYRSLMICPLVLLFGT